MINLLFSVHLPLFSVKMCSLFQCFLTWSKCGKTSKNILIINGVVFFFVFCPFFVKPLPAQAFQVVDESISGFFVLWKFGENTGVQTDDFVFKALDEVKEAIGEVRIFFGKFGSFLADFFISDGDKSTNKNDQDRDNNSLYINILISFLVAAWLSLWILYDKGEEN